LNYHEQDRLKSLYTILGIWMWWHSKNYQHFGGTCFILWGQS